MARPPKPTPHKVIQVALPVETLTRMELKLYSPLEGRVPYGARQAYIVRLIEADLKKDMQK